MPLLDDDRVARLVKARQEVEQQVSGAYDEVLDEVVGRIRGSGSIGKLDIGALLFWKRLQANTPWAAQLHAMPEVQVRRITAVAVQAVTDELLDTPEAARQGRSALSPLPGLSTGDALASALLLAAAPERMAVYDRRAQTALQRLGVELSPAPGRFGRYMDLVEQLRTQAAAVAGQPWKARDVDLALYWLGG
ncbi:hypothetical protein SAMN05660359_00921 [Geodermatophilus obscurus]|uniref:Uncharacterized protein n=1 Tax=Geodermatophilus obscurus TaxID=1861 RepID=A0A1I5DNQ3_9ACTN|nr:hypothetical protein [Geodermatophilus obscurus]SFO00828.1 hypothetical protein SAMN05660359_00921 [Geodermatophilus obscurus]